MKVYYAHCIALYGTPQEARDVQTLVNFGFGVVNPGSPEIDAQAKDLRRALETRNEDLATFPKVDIGEAVMNQIFKPLVEGCDALAFRSLPDGRVPAGVQNEIEWALEARKPVIELPSNLTGRAMTVAHTREYLREVGAR